MNDIMKHYSNRTNHSQNIPKPYSYLITYPLLYLVTFLNPYYIYYVYRYIKLPQTPICLYQYSMQNRFIH